MKRSKAPQPPRPAPQVRPAPAFQIKPAGMPKMRPNLPARPNAPQFARPTPAPRPSTGFQVVNNKLEQARQLRREGVREAVSQVQNARPRPIVKPAGPPQKIMPARPKPVLPPGLKARPRPGGVVTPAPFQRPVPGAGVGVAGGVGAASVAKVNAAATANQALMADVMALQNTLSMLQSQANFNDIQADISALDGSLNRVSELLESARQKGYRYGADLDDRVNQAISRWATVQPQVVQMAQQQSGLVQNQVLNLNNQVNRLNSVMANPAMASSQLRSTSSLANQAMQVVAQARSGVERIYADLEGEASSLQVQLSAIHWMLDQQAQAKFSLDKDENLVRAVRARWDKEGKEDPEGILYLTDKRLIFERKEKVATKKILFITTEMQLVQEILIDQPFSGITSFQAVSKGLFGHQDFLKLQFSDRKLGDVDMHLDGQDSEEWAGLVGKAKSGQLAADKVSGIAGVSVADMTRPLTQADLLELQANVNALQDEMMLKAAREELGSLENAVSSLERKLGDLRSRGYEIEKDLEPDIKVLAAQWERVKGNTEKTIDAQAALLGEQMQVVQSDLGKLLGMANNMAAARPQYIQVKSGLASSSAQADAALATVMVQYDQYADEIETLDAHLDWVGWMLDALSSASFSLFALESGVAATEATFQAPGGEVENGILFLTDKRLLWEDRVGTYELRLDVPITAVQETSKEVNPESGEETLIFRLAAPAPLPEARFPLSLPVADDWFKMVGRARTGGYAQDRVETLTAEELERIKNAPQQCGQCGAAFTAPLMRGQSEITCEYCGLVTRI